MQRFLATRGKMGTLSSGFVTASMSPAPVQVPVPPITTNKLADTSLDERQVSTDEQFEVPHPNVTTKWLAHPFHIKEVSGSNFGPETSHPDRFFVVFLRPSKQMPG
jgi:hypothetical protein